MERQGLQCQRRTPRRPDTRLNRQAQHEVPLIEIQTTGLGGVKVNTALDFGVLVALPGAACDPR